MTLAPASELAARFTRVPHPSPSTDEERARAMAKLAFGVNFTDHMARVTYTEGEGWHSQTLEPYGPLQMMPAAAVLHYGQEIFEGMKAYRHDDGSIWTFRPDMNADRMNRSARRLVIPDLPAEDFVGSIAALVQADAEWVPRTPGASLYLRPFTFASEPFLGVRAAHQYTFLTIASPVGPYFAHGFQPVAVWVTHDYHRAGPGGTGAAKTGGNYASSLLPKEITKKEGFEEVLFLDGATGTLVEELGGMNFMAVDKDGTVHTPALDHATILPGITRDSLLHILEDRGVAVKQEDISLAWLLDGIRSGEIVETFACGTAAVITPIGRLASHEFDVTIADGEPGELTRSLYDELTGIQYGTVEDRFNWLYQLA